jgi:hypothetical protein
LFIDDNFSYKNPNIREIVGDALLWILWKERNKLIFEGVTVNL